MHPGNDFSRYGDDQHDFFDFRAYAPGALPWHQQPDALWPLDAAALFVCDGTFTRDHTESMQRFLDRSRGIDPHAVVRFRWLIHGFQVHAYYGGGTAPLVLLNVMVYDLPFDYTSGFGTGPSAIDDWGIDDGIEPRAAGES